MDKLNEFLVSIGFKENETRVYSILLESGISSVLDISKKTNMHRSNVYDSLRSLVQKGLVYEVEDEKKMFYARPLSSLLIYIKEKDLELNELIKEQENKISKKPFETKTRISKGVFAMRESIYNLLETNAPISVYGIPDKAPEMIGPILNEFHKKRVKLKVLMRHIYNSNAMERVSYLNKMAYTEARILPSKYNTIATTIISGDKVKIILWEDEITVIEIIDNDIAKSYQNYFEILWKKARVV